jgi:hypothetical protein
MALDTPAASYDKSSLKQNLDSKVGTRGYSGLLPSVTTNLTGANNDLVITAKHSRRENEPGIAVQYSVLGNNAPAWLFEDGYPAVLKPATNLGFQLLAKVPGPLGNLYSLTLVDPFKIAPLQVQKIIDNSIVVQLARSGSGLTTTPAQLVAALRAASEVTRRVVPYISDAAITTALPALSQRFFTGGLEAPGLVLVQLANTDGTISATATSVVAILNGSRHVKAVNAAGNTGVGVVTAMGITRLVGDTVSRGEIASEGDYREDWNQMARRRGNPVGKESNRTIQVEGNRLGGLRDLIATPRLDRALRNSSNVNYQKESSPRRARWF